MAAIRSSSVIALFIWAAAFVVAGFALDLLVDCSFLDEFLALMGILPVMYLAARPAPGFMGGRRRARTDVDRGIMVVSSSYSIQLLVCRLTSWLQVSTYLLFHLQCRL